MTLYYSRVFDMVPLVKHFVKMQSQSLRVTQRTHRQLSLLKQPLSTRGCVHSSRVGHGELSHYPSSRKYHCVLCHLFTLIKRYLIASPSPQLEKDITEPSTERRAGRLKLESWLNEIMRIRMTDGRVVVGTFVCTDKDKNVILGNAVEYINVDQSNESKSLLPCTPFSSQPYEANRAPRTLGLAMVPGNHIVSVHLDQSKGSKATK